MFSVAKFHQIAICMNEEVEACFCLKKIIGEALQGLEHWIC